MSIGQVLETIRAFDGVVELAPTEGSGFPEIAWGDHFFYYSADGRIADRVQPYATIVTKDYPDDSQSELSPPGRFRVNIQVGKKKFTELTGHGPRDIAAARDFSEPDVVLPHPVYAAQAWIAVVNPGQRTLTTVLALLHEAHENARFRANRRAARQATNAAPAADQ